MSESKDTGSVKETAQKPTRQKRKSRPPTLAERVQAVLSDEAAWWQAPLLVVLLLAAALMLYLMGTQQTEFIYALL